MSEHIARLLRPSPWIQRIDPGLLTGVTRRLVQVCILWIWFFQCHGIQAWRELTAEEVWVSRKTRTKNIHRTNCRTFPTLPRGVRMPQRKYHTDWPPVPTRKPHRSASRTLIVTLHPHIYESILVLTRTRVTGHHVTYRVRTIPLLSLIHI